MEYSSSPSEFPVTTLLRRARDTYGLAIRVRLSAEGLSDLPKNGPYFVGGLANGAHTEELTNEMGLSDVQVEQLLEALLKGDFVAPDEALGAENPLALALTEKGFRAARVIAEAISHVNHELSHLVGPDEIAGFRSTLAALREIRERTEESLR
jgi:hypothetical protein